MLKDLRVVRRSARIAADNALGARDAYAHGRIKHEPEITDRMLGAIENGLNGRRLKGVKWEAATLTNAGANSEESRFGADFMGVLDINLDTYRISKGFLAQAKRIEPDGYFRKRERERLLNQCKRMLSRSIASFVFLYSRDDIRVVPASAVCASSAVNPWDLYPIAISGFFERHFECFFGDIRISSSNIRDLRLLSDEFDVRSAVLLSVAPSREHRRRLSHREET